MKDTGLISFLILLFSITVFPQNNCSETQIQKAKVFAQTTTSEPLKFEIERGYFGDCIHHKWMDKMKEAGIKTSVAVVDFSWQNGLKKVNVKEMEFAENYNFSYTTNKKLLNLIEKSGLKKDLEEAFIARTEFVLFIILSDAKKTPDKKNNDVIKGKVYVHLFDDETLPLQITTSDTEIF